MPSLPRITGKEFVRALQRGGFEIARQKGSHVQMRKYVKGEKITFPVPVHSGKIIKLGTFKGILRLSGLTLDEFLKLI